MAHLPKNLHKNIYPLIKQLSKNKVLKDEGWAGLNTFDLFFWVTEDLVLEVMKKILQYPPHRSLILFYFNVGYHRFTPRHLSLFDFLLSLSEEKRSQVLNLVWAHIQKHQTLKSYAGYYWYAKDLSAGLLMIYAAFIKTNTEEIQKIKSSIAFKEFKKQIEVSGAFFVDHLTWWVGKSWDLREWDFCFSNIDLSINKPREVKICHERMRRGEDEDFFDSLHTIIKASLDGDGKVFGRGDFIKDNIRAWVQQSKCGEEEYLYYFWSSSVVKLILQEESEERVFKNLQWSGFRAWQKKTQEELKVLQSSAIGKKLPEFIGIDWEKVFLELDQLDVALKTAHIILVLDSSNAYFDMPEFKEMHALRAVLWLKYSVEVNMGNDDASVSFMELFQMYKVGVQKIEIMAYSNARQSKKLNHLKSLEESSYLLLSGSLLYYSSAGSWLSLLIHKSPIKCVRLEKFLEGFDGSVPKYNMDKDYWWKKAKKIIQQKAEVGFATLKDKSGETLEQRLRHLFGLRYEKYESVYREKLLRKNLKSEAKQKSMGQQKGSKRL